MTTYYTASSHCNDSGETATLTLSRDPLTPHTVRVYCHLCAAEWSTQWPYWEENAEPIDGPPAFLP